MDFKKFVEDKEGYLFGNGIIHPMLLGFPSYSKVK